MISFLDTTIFSISSVWILVLVSCKKEKSHRRCVYNPSQTECNRNISCVCNHNIIMYVINTKAYIHQGDTIRLRQLHTRWSVITYQSFGLDKNKSLAHCKCFIFWSWKRDSNTRPMVVFKDKFVELVLVNIVMDEVLHHNILYHILRVWIGQLYICHLQFL